MPTWKDDMLKYKSVLMDTSSKRKPQQLMPPGENTLCVGGS
jgi:hypothetical protein